MQTNTVALISVDNTRTFEDQSLNELYVGGGEIAAKETYACMQIIKQAGGLLYNVLEAHPAGHLSLASNYLDKAPFTFLTKEEVAQWTETKHLIGPKAAFTLEELKAFLEKNTVQMLRPDHSLAGTPGVDLMPPLSTDQFDTTIIKGTNAAVEEYSGFSNGQLHQALSKDGVDTVIITGVATDYCVLDTALDAVEHGYTTYLVTDAIAGVAPESATRALETMRTEGVILITKAQLQTHFAPVTA